LGHNINTINKSIDILSEASKEVGLEVNADKMKLMPHQIAGQCHNNMIAKNS